MLSCRYVFIVDAHSFAVHQHKEANRDEVCEHSYKLLDNRGNVFIEAIAKPIKEFTSDREQEWKTED